MPLLTIFLNTLFIHKYKVREVYGTRDTIDMFLVLSRVFHFRECDGFRVAPGKLCKGSCIRNSLDCHWRIVVFLLHALGQNDNSKNDNERSKYSYLHWFTFMALTRLIVTSAIPIVFFYISSYNFEQNLLARNRQYNYAAHLRDKFPVQDSLQSVIKTVQPPNNNYNHAVYTDSEWINSLGIVNKMPGTHALLREDTTTAELFNHFGSYFEYISGLDNDNFYLSAPPGYAYRFNNFFEKYCTKKIITNSMFH